MPFNTSQATAHIEDTYVRAAEAYSGDKIAIYEGPHASTVAERDAVARQIGLSGSYADFVAAATLAGRNVPGRSPASITADVGELQSANDDTLRVLRAFAKTYTPALVIPGTEAPGLARNYFW